MVIEIIEWLSKTKLITTINLFWKFSEQGWDGRRLESEDVMNSSEIGEDDFEDDELDEDDEISVT